MKLTAKAVAAARYEGKARKFTDGHGLYLHVTATARTWRYNFRLGGKQREYTIGPAELVTLAQAREEHRRARVMVLAGTDPIAVRAAERDPHREAETVGAYLDEWMRRGLKKWSTKNSDKIQSRLENVSDRFRRIRITALGPGDVLDELTAIGQVRSVDLAHRIRGYVASALDPAVIAETVPSNPARHPLLTNRLPPRPVQTPFAHVTDPAVLGRVCRLVESHEGEYRVGVALWLQLRLFCRPTELRELAWSEVNFDEALLEIPAERMKSGRPHLIPLARQCVEKLRRLEEVDRRADLVFYGVRDRRKAVSDMTISAALRRCGVSNEILVPHGTRHTASTALNERQFEVDGRPVRFSPDAIEAQLAHVPAGIRAKYNRAKYIDERRQMMQAYADWLDALRDASPTPHR